MNQQDNLAIVYNEIYSENPNVFGESAEFVKKAVGYKDGGCALDLGSGEGRNAIFLAEHGFVVDAIDISQVATRKLKKEAHLKRLAIHAITADVRTAEISKDYDMIVVFFLLHLFRRKTALELIEKLTDKTKRGGLHVIAAFTRHGDFYNNTPDNFFLREKELKELYPGWEVLDYEEKKEDALAKHEDGTPMKNVCAYMIVKKPV